MWLYDVNACVYGKLVIITRQVAQEVERRRRLSVTSAERTAAIRQVYQPLHSHVYRLQVCPIEHIIPSE